MDTDNLPETMPDNNRADHDDTMQQWWYHDYMTAVRHLALLAKQEIKLMDMADNDNALAVLHRERAAIYRVFPVITQPTYYRPNNIELGNPPF